MDAELNRFASHANSTSVNRLLAMAELIKIIPQPKMDKVSKLHVDWEICDDDYLPKLSLEFFP